MGRLEGDGTSCSELSAGKKYVAACLYNAYEFRIYQLNDRTSSRKANLKKEYGKQSKNISYHYFLLILTESSKSVANGKKSQK